MHQIWMNPSSQHNNHSPSTQRHRGGGTLVKLGLMLMTFLALQTSVAAEQIGRGKAKSIEEVENE